MKFLLPFLSALAGVALFAPASAAWAVEVEEDFAVFQGPVWVYDKEDGSGSSWFPELQDTPPPGFDSVGRLSLPFTSPTLITSPSGEIVSYRPDFSCQDPVGTKDFPNCSLKVDFSSPGGSWRPRLAVEALFYRFTGGVVGRASRVAAIVEDEFVFEDFYRSFNTFQSTSLTDGTVYFGGANLPFTSTNQGACLAFTPGCYVFNSSLSSSVLTNWHNDSNNAGGFDPSASNGFRPYYFHFQVVWEAQTPLNPELPVFTAGSFRPLQLAPSSGLVCEQQLPIPQLLFSGASANNGVGSYGGTKRQINSIGVYYLPGAQQLEPRPIPAPEDLGCSAGLHGLVWTPDTPPPPPITPPVEIPDTPEVPKPDPVTPPSLPEPNPVEPNPVEECGFSVGCYFNYYFVPSQSIGDAVEGLADSSGLGGKIASARAFIDSIYAGGVCPLVTFPWAEGLEQSFQPCVPGVASITKPITTLVGWCGVLWLALTYLWGLFKPNLDGA